MSTATGPTAKTASRPSPLDGAQPEGILRTEFFAFFYLTETSRSGPGEGETSIVYQNPAPQFHDLTLSEIVADGYGTARLALLID
jgi:hypothetical protein